MKSAYKNGLGCDGFREIRVEFTNKCKCRCFFCPREKLTRSKGIMSFEELHLLIARVDEFLDEPFSGELHLVGYGESLLDPHVPSKAALLKSHWPNATNIFISTLSQELCDDWVRELVASLDILRVSMYGFTQKAYKELTGLNALDRVRHNLETFSRIRDEINPQMEIMVKTALYGTENYMIHDPNFGREEFETWLDSIRILHSQIRLHNYGNDRIYVPYESKKTCSIVRGNRSQILVVTWDLNISPCSFDFDSEMSLGSLKKHKLKEILEGDISRKLIESHLGEDLSSYPICQKCICHGTVAKSNKSH